MELIAGIIGIAGLLTLGATVLGVIRPSLFKNKETGENPKRGRLLVRGIGASLFLFIITGWLAPASEVASSQSPQDSGEANETHAKIVGSWSCTTYTNDVRNSDHLEFQEGGKAIVSGNTPASYELNGTDFVLKLSNLAITGTFTFSNKDAFHLVGTSITKNGWEVKRVDFQCSRDSVSSAGSSTGSTAVSEPRSNSTPSDPDAAVADSLAQLHNAINQAEANGNPVCADTIPLWRSEWGKLFEMTQSDSYRFNKDIMVSIIRNQVNVWLNQIHSLGCTT